MLTSNVEYSLSSLNVYMCRAIGAVPQYHDTKLGQRMNIIVVTEFMHTSETLILIGNADVENVLFYKHNQQIDKKLLLLS